MTIDLNRLSAEVIMGYTEYFESPGGLYHCMNNEGKWITWSPLTDMNQCFQVIKRMVEDGWRRRVDADKTGIRVEFFKGMIFNKIYSGIGFSKTNEGKATLTAALKAQALIPALEKALEEVK